MCIVQGVVDERDGSDPTAHVWLGDFGPALAEMVAEMQISEEPRKMLLDEAPSRRFNVRLPRGDNVELKALGELFEGLSGAGQGPDARKIVALVELVDPVDGLFPVRHAAFLHLPEKITVEMLQR
eukprot:CAMPEP_0118991126 /NCGR_PEP_ID=MMETSP1173-20130426/51097_1 /TAXON_ID=1034831 /ORGANISM="Rhizochromulina marina cf, Strain CCMP1243" /LENGTH=124 /DNA_ID=CAMNT_0006942233 /DNA_START=195 /DNA_END=569 /DNA_ORIENTATION=-